MTVSKAGQKVLLTGPADAGLGAVLSSGSSTGTDTIRLTEAQTDGLFRGEMLLSTISVDVGDLVNIKTGMESRSVRRRALPPNVERGWFTSRRSKLLADHEGQYVAVHNCAVVAAGDDLPRLIGEFVRQFGEGSSVYFGFVGSEPVGSLPL